MKVLLLTHRFLPFYGDNFIRQIVSEERDKGNYVRVYTSPCFDIEYFFNPAAKHISKRREFIKGFDVNRIPLYHFKYNKRLALYFSNIPGLKNFFKGSFIFYPNYPFSVLSDRRKYDVVYVGPLPFSYLFATAILRKILFKEKIVGIPLVHPPYMEDRVREVEYIENFHLLNKLDEVITLSMAEKEYLENHGVKSRIKYITPKIEVPEVPEYKTDMPYFVQVSYLDERKGVGDFLRAMEFFWRSGENVKAILIGKVSSNFRNEFENFKDRYGNYIEHYEDVSEEFKFSVIKGSITLVMVSTADSYGYVYKEAILYGKKPIGSYYGFLPDIWKGQLEYVPVNHPYLLYKKMKNYL